MVLRDVDRLDACASIGTLLGWDAFNRDGGKRGLGIEEQQAAPGSPPVVKLVPVAAVERAVGVIFQTACLAGCIRPASSSAASLSASAMPS